MRQRQLNRVAHHLRRVVHSVTEQRLNDAELLERFVVDRDEMAFAELVERHGPMVLGVCRRVTGDAHDADDAYQATFLVLVRRAAAVWPRDQVGNWLHGVAFRTAVEARKRSERRRLRERPTDPLPHPAVDPPAPQDWRPIFDQELRQLPAKYRIAVIICELEGRSRREAARHLGVAEGTLSSRLAAARRLLGERLARRGVAPAVALLAAALAREADAANPIFSQSISQNAIEIMEGVLKVMTMNKLKAWAVVLVALVATAGGGTMLASGFGAGPEPPRNPEVPSAPIPTPVPMPAEGIKQFQIDLTVVEVGNKERRLLSKPQIVVLSGQAARVEVGGQEAVADADKVEFMPVGVRATLTATAAENDKIRLEAFFECTSRNQRETEPTWLTSSVRAIRRVTPGKAVKIEFSSGDEKHSTIEVIAAVKAMQTIHVWPTPVTHVPSPAEKDWRAAEFYRRIGHTGSAHFYYELIVRRHEGTPFAEKARERLKEKNEKASSSQDEKPFRVGMIQIIGNVNTMTSDILKHVSLYPGAVISYKDVQETEKRLSKLPGFKSPPMITFRDPEDDTEFKDVIITIEEE
jgi:RNA polymerase sigma factor (sigma-70 family)